MEPGPPFSGVVGGTRQGGRTEGGPGDTVWNIWGLAPSPAINEKGRSAVGPSLPRMPGLFQSQLPQVTTMSLLTELFPTNSALGLPSQTASSTIHLPDPRFPHFSLKWQKLTRRRV